MIDTTSTTTADPPLGILLRISRDENVFYTSDTVGLRYGTGETLREAVGMWADCVQDALDETNAGGAYLNEVRAYRAALAGPQTKEQTILPTSLGRFRKIAGPDTPFVDRWLFECPGCGTWAYLDDDQWHGRVSVDHSGEFSPTTGVVCSYHETHDYFAVLETACNQPPAQTEEQT